MSLVFRPQLAFWRFVSLFEGQHGPQILALLILVFVTCFITVGLALAEALRLFPPPEPIQLTAPPPPLTPQPGPGAAESFLSLVGVWVAFVGGPIAVYHVLVAFAENLIDEAVDRVHRARYAADV